MVAPASSGSVGAAVPAGAAPGPHTVQGVCASQELSASAVFTVLGPTTTKPPVTTTKPPVVTTKPPVVTTKPPVTTTTTTTPTTTTTTTTPVEIETPESVTEEPPPPADGVLQLDRASINPGDPLVASGIGCDPGANVELTSEGERVGRAVADGAGAFGTLIEFTRIEPGKHWVLADCGIRLAGAVEQTLTSSTGGGSAALVVLVFFVLAGITLVRVR
ncbi:hypothetical protein [Amycolatopsis sp. YIM 10]|uniref:hypothetical protein n=1 Tax=Amycolatopsis sp. YIM 10 TaxID=2653857 RepID=UPI001D13EA49|nr:hypothetical protein [Amycolatopsis sp. YIM 10]